MTNRSMQSAASRLGISIADYAAFLEAGLKWCTSCKDWHDRSAFGRDAGRGDGLKAECLSSRHVQPRSALERFQEKVGLPTAIGCIEWLGSKYPAGYGSFWYEDRVQPAQRVAWLLFVGLIPDGLYVLHRCDNRPCVNHEHLFLGTHQDNMDDMAAKGRRVSLSGESHPKAKLTEEHVIEIRRLRGLVSQQKLAQRFGVTKTAIGLIQRGKNWASVREFPEVARGL